jgi:hypothetical protein
MNRWGEELVEGRTEELRKQGRELGASATGTNIHIYRFDVCMYLCVFKLGESLLNDVQYGF